MRKLLATLCTLLSLPVLAAPRSMELQFQADTVVPLLEDRIVSSLSCIPPFQLGGVDAYLDHLAFPSAAHFRRSPSTQPVTINANLTFPSTPLQLAVPLQAFIKTKAAMEDPNVPQGQYLASPTGEAILDLSVSQGADGAQKLCGNITGFEPSFPGASTLVAQLQALVGPQCFALPFDGLDDLIDNRVTLTGEAISANSTFDRLALRLEFDQPNPAQSFWEPFILGGLSPSPASGFSLTVDQELLAGAVRNEVQNKLKDIDHLALEIPPGVTSAWTPSQPKLTLNFALDADPVICPKIPVDGEVVGQFALASGGTHITLSGQVGLSPDPGMLALCIAINPLVLTTISDPINQAVGVGLISLLPSIGDFLPSQCTVSTDGVVSCDLPLQLPTLTSPHHTTTLAANSLSVLGGSLVLSGTATTTGTTPKPPSVVINDTDFFYGLRGRCNSLSIGYWGEWVVEGHAQVCDALAIQHDPYGVFGGLTNFATAGWTTELTYSPGNPNYVALPYYATVKTRTSGGGRTVKLGPITEATQAMKDEALKQKALAEAACIQWGSGLGRVGTFDFRWTVDPPPEFVGLIRSRDPQWRGISPRIFLNDVTAETIGVTTRPAGSSFVLREQDVRLTGTATVDYGRAGRQVVKVSTIVHSDVVGSELAQTGLLRLSLPPRTLASFTIPQGTALPGIDGIDFNADVSITNASFAGALDVR